MELAKPDPKLPTVNINANSLKLSVTAIIPCFNVSHSISELLDKVKNYADSVIVVDDGSQDGTAEIATIKGALVLSHNKNLGKGAAMKTGWQNANADIIVFIDGDSQHNPSDIPGIIAPIISGEADMVIGSRHLNGSAISSPSRTRRICNVLASFTISVVVSVLLPTLSSINRLRYNILRKKREPALRAESPPKPMRWVWITDCTSGFRAVKKQSWERIELVSQAFQIETEMIYEAAKNGLVIKEVPISCRWRNGLSRLSILKDGSKTLRMLMSKLLKDARVEM